MICMCLASLLALGALISRSPPAPGRSELAQQTLANDDLTTGSVLLVPPAGNRCQLRLIDNATGYIWGNKPVDCQIALANANARSNNAPTTHLDAIRDGFRNR